MAGACLAGWTNAGNISAIDRGILHGEGGKDSTRFATILSIYDPPLRVNKQIGAIISDTNNHVGRSPWELAPNNINVNNIAPGAIETEMAKFAHDAATRSAYNYLIPISRYGTPEERRGPKKGNGPRLDVRRNSGPDLHFRRQQRLRLAI